MNNDDELWHRFPQLSLRHSVPRKHAVPCKAPNLSATKQKKCPFISDTEAEEKRWKTFDVHETR